METILKIFTVMQATPRHTYMVLTKRPERMLDFCIKYGLWGSGEKWPANVWPGVSVEDKATLGRVDGLMEAPQAVKFVSYEPALEGLDFEPYLKRGLDMIIVGGESGKDARPFDITWARSVIRQCAKYGAAAFVKQLGAIAFEGDSHHSHLAGHRGYSVVCDEGEPCPYCGRQRMQWLTLNLRHKKGGGDMSDWPEDLRVREFPKAEVTV